MLMYRWRREGVGRGPLSAAKRKRNGGAGSSGLWIFEEAASANSRWRVWVEKEPSKEFGDGRFTDGEGLARQGQARILLPRCSKANQKREWEAGQAQAGAHAPMVGRRCCLSVRDGRACLLLSGASSEGRSIPGRYCTTVVVQSLKAASAARDASLGQVGVGLG